MAIIRQTLPAKKKNKMKKEKKFFIPANNIKDLLTDWNEAGGCFASDRITVDGLPVGYIEGEYTGGEKSGRWIQHNHKENTQTCTWHGEGGA